MAAAYAAVAASRHVAQLSDRERNSLLRQLHKDNSWLLEQLKDSHTALESVHEKLEAEQQARLAPALCFARHWLTACSTMCMCS